METNGSTSPLFELTPPRSEGLTDQPLSSEAAFWMPEGGSALLMYDEMRQ